MSCKSSNIFASNFVLIGPIFIFSNIFSTDGILKRLFKAASAASTCENHAESVRVIEQEAMFPKRNVALAWSVQLITMPQ
jgi:hypothetical protein